MKWPLCRRFILAVVFVSLAQASAAVGQAVDLGARSAARELARRGLSLQAEGKYVEALDAFDRANEVMHLPSLGLAAARCLVKLERWVEASERFRATSLMQYEPAGLSKPQRKVQEQAKQDAEREGIELGSKIPAAATVAPTEPGATPAPVEPITPQALPETTPPAATSVVVSTPPIAQEPTPVHENSLDLNQHPATQGAAPGPSSRWWLWTGVGAVVVAAAVTAVILSTRGPERDVSCPSGVNGCLSVGK